MNLCGTGEFYLITVQPISPSGTAQFPSTAGISAENSQRRFTVSN